MLGGRDDSTDKGIEDNWFRATYPDSLRYSLSSLELVL